MNAAPVIRRWRDTRVRSAVASLVPMMAATSRASRSRVSTEMLGDGTAWNIVDDDRDVGCRGHRPEVAVEPLLRGLVVIGDDDQRGIGAGMGRVAGEFDRFGGAVRAGAGNHRDAAGRGLDRDLDDALVLVGRQVGDSPVVPTGTMPLVPSAICHSISSRKPCSSTAPLRKGVMRAVIEPFKSTAIAPRRCVIPG